MAILHGGHVILYSVQILPQ